MIFLAYLALGAVAGVLAGLFGIGGGLIIVPTLILSFELQGMDPGVQAHLAVGTSLATIVFTAISSIRSHHARGSVRWDLVRYLAVGLVIGAALGSQTAARMSGESLRLLIGLFALAMAVKMWLDLKPKPGRDVPGR
ncbi:MAG: sulfite exporter TauE/SafE family protein, partial [Gammaproteobacteria bacterium]